MIASSVFGHGTPVSTIFPPTYWAALPGRTAETVQWYRELLAPYAAIEDVITASSS